MILLKTFLTPNTPLIITNPFGFMLFNVETYEAYAKKCQKVTNDLVQQVVDLKREGYKVVGYGAAAKGNTLLNFAQLDLDYIVDDNDLKWDYMTPGRNIPIKSPSCLSDEEAEKLIIVPLAWNFFKEIREKSIQLTNNDVKFIKYFPELQIL